MHAELLSALSVSVSLCHSPPRPKGPLWLRSPVSDLPTAWLGDRRWCLAGYHACTAHQAA